MIRRLAVLALPVLLALGACGSGSGSDAAAPATPIDFLPGARVGELAEKQLEAEHLEMALGTMTCPDLDWELKASVRCLKISELSDGRRVKVPGTVTVTSTEGAGRLHVVLDDEPAEFGVDGEHLDGVVESWVAGQDVDGRGDCPYLTGAVGQEVRCAVAVDGVRYSVLVTVTKVDPENFRTEYVLAWEGTSPAG